MTRERSSDTTGPRRWTIWRFSADLPWHVQQPTTRQHGVRIPAGEHEGIEVMPVEEHEEALRAVSDVYLGELHGELVRLREAAQAVVDGGDRQEDRAVAEEWLALEALRAALGSEEGKTG